MKAKPKATRKALRLPDPNRFEKRLTTLPTDDPDTLETRVEKCLTSGAAWIREALAKSGETYVLKCLHKSGLDITGPRLRKWLKDHPET